MAIYKNTPPIVTNGLISYVDIANTNSYISGSSKVTNLNDTTTGSFDTIPFFDPSNGGTLNLNGTQTLLFLTSSAFNTITTNNSLTLSVWFKTPSTGSYRDVVGINKAAGGNPFVIRFNSSNSLLYDTFVGGTRYTPRIINTVMPTNTWIHACATFGNNLITTYYNGNLVNTQVTSGSLEAFSSNQFGVYPIGYGFYLGNISNFQLYNRALTQAEVLQNYNATKLRFNII